jgi:NADH-quinone oxidoreductase subunit M
MSEQLMFPWVSVSLLILIASTIRTHRMAVPEAARRATAYAMGAVFLLLVAAGIEVERAGGVPLHEPLPGWGQWAVLDPLNGLPLPLYTGLALGMVVLAPRRKVTAAWLVGIQIVTLTTMVAYATNHLALFAFAWGASLIPFFGSGFFNRETDVRIPLGARVILLTSAALVLLGAVLLALGTESAQWSAKLSLGLARPGSSPLLYLAFGCLMAGVFLRKGLFPFHAWVTRSFEQGPLIPLTLLFNSHLGAFLIARLAVPAFPEIAAAALPLLGNLGLLTAGYTAILALSERQPRRLLALLTISQSSFLVVGLESTHPDAITGALVLWQVVVVATSILTAVYTGLEARLTKPIDGQGSLGLGKMAPRLAVFFLISGLALVGLPLTLGFPAEDLLLHGTLETHPQLGIILPIVTALNAFNLMRLFTSLFLGQPGPAAMAIRDALPRERWVLTLAILFLILGGLFPGIFVHLPERAASNLLSSKAQVGGPTPQAGAAHGGSSRR